MKITLSAVMSLVAILLVLVLAWRISNAPSMVTIDEKLAALANDIQPLKEMAAALEEGFGDGAPVPQGTPVAQVQTPDAEPANEPVANDNKWKRIVYNMRQSWSSNAPQALPQQGGTASVAMSSSDDDCQLARDVAHVVNENRAMAERINRARDVLEEGQPVGRPLSIPLGN